MSPTPLLRIRRLAGKDGLKLGLGHARSRQSPRALDRFAGALTTITRSTFASPPVSNNNGTSTIDQSAAGGLGALEKLSARLRDGRMHEPFKTPQRLGVAQHLRSKAFAIDLSRDDNARKRRLDRCRPLSGVEVSDGLVGVKCRDAKLGEHGPRRSTSPSRSSLSVRQ